MKKYDVAIIGAGTAGLTARRQVAKKTDNYIVIDDGILGTTCARVGCMPSKVLIQVANDYHRRHSFAQMGISGGENLAIDHKAVMRHVRKLRDRFVRGVLSDMESWKDNHFVAKRAHFVDQNTLDLGDEKIWAKKIIIGTGSRPIIPNDWKPLQKYFIDTNSFFELEELPQKVAVIGLGVIGIELGQALHRIGVDVIGIGRSCSIGGVTDPEVVNYVADKFSEEMPIVFGGVESLKEVEGKIHIKTKKGSEHIVDKVLLSMGRKPNVDKIGLEEIGIHLDEKGIPKFDPYTYQIEGAPIFIAGDVNDERPILHESADEGSIAGFNAVRENLQGFKRRTWIGVTFSSPNIATVGKTFRELESEGAVFESGRVSFEGQGRSIVMLKEKGLLKVYGDKKSGRLLGAEIFGPSGEHIAHLISWAISNDMTVNQALSMPFYHPVIEEGLRTALRDLASKVEESRPDLDLKLI